MQRLSFLLLYIAICSTADLYFPARVHAETANRGTVNGQVAGAETGDPLPRAFEVFAIDRNLARSRAPATTTVDLDMPRIWIGGILALGVAILLIIVQTARVFQRERTLRFLNAQLQQSHDELEARVEERTAELSDANASLKKQIQERLRAEEARWTVERELEAQKALSMRADRLRSLVLLCQLMDRLVSFWQTGGYQWTSKHRQTLCPS